MPWLLLKNPRATNRHESSCGRAAQEIITIWFETKNDMDAERINTIGNLLVDLGARTLDLRRYL